MQTCLYKSLIVLVLFACFTTSAKQNSVKLTQNGLCLTYSHPLYSEKDVEFEITYSLEDCLNKGGRLPYSAKTRREIDSTFLTSSDVAKTIKPFSQYDWPHFLPSPTPHIDVAQFLLAKTSHIPPQVSGSGIVQSGMWHCPLTDIKMYRISEVEVMHIVSLQYAHDNGASRWSRAEKGIFANDFLNLLPVHQSVINDKKQRGLAWLPQENRCWYFKRFDAVMKKYQLSYALDDRDIRDDMQKKCN